MEDNLNSEEKEFEVKLRPAFFKDFSGQKKIIDNLSIFVKAANQREDSLDHVLLHGPPGLGKTTLASVISNELGVNISEGLENNNHLKPHSQHKSSL